MSDERNADSVLFKLDTLSAMQAHASKASKAGAPRQMARLAAPTPQSETGSGLIDLNTLAGATQLESHESCTGGSASELRSSAALSQSTLLSSSSIAPATAPLVQAPAPSRTPLLILSVLALIALAAAVGAIVLRG